MKKDVGGMVVFVRVTAWPRRALVVKRAVEAVDYFSYCDEVGCGVWNELKGMPDAVGEPLGMWIPEAMRPAGTSVYVQGVEVPAAYEGSIPAGFDVMELGPCCFMVFQGAPYEDEQFWDAIGVVQEAIRLFNPLTHGYEWADEEGPRIQWEPIGARGYIEARPVRIGGTRGIFPNIGTMCEM